MAKAASVPARYYRLYLGEHIIGFRRVLLSGKNAGTVEYLPMTGRKWTREKLDYDGDVLLSNPPAGTSK